MRSRERPEPVLRSPPFPGIAPADATVLAARHGGDDAGVTVAAIAAAIVAARVGGRFWGKRYPGRRRLCVGLPPPGSRLDDAAVLLSSGSRSAAGALEARGALVIPEDADPWPLLDVADEVEGETGESVVLLALAAGKPVTDAGAAVTPARAEALLAGALLDGRRYREPATGRTIDILAAIAILAEWRRLIDANRGIAAATGIAWWKRREVERLLWDGRDGRLPFRRGAAALALAAPGQAVAAWPSRTPAGFAAEARRIGVAVRWVEDGFLRSVGLGSELVPPLSLSVDTRAPYYDPNQPTDLEVLLETCCFPPTLVARAAALRERIVAGRIGKYRSGGRPATHLFYPRDRPMVLVLGQVEDDLSVLRGGGEVAGNLDLLRRVRAEEPGSWIVYRPHPDVEAGQRLGAVPDGAALGHADAVVRDGALDDWIDAAARVHVLTSLAGFEALLRRRPVVVHGSPFYAGWGLTVDRGAPLVRRTRRLSLDELVAGVLVLYPRYLHPVRQLPCPPDAFIEALEVGGGRVSWLVRIRRLQGWLRRTSTWSGA